MRKKPTSRAGKAGIAAIKLAGISAPFVELRAPARGQGSIRAPSSLWLDERPWKSALGLFLQRLFVITDEARGNDRADHGDNEDGDSDGPCVMFKGAAKKIAADAKD